MQELLLRIEPHPFSKDPAAHISVVSASMPPRTVSVPLSELKSNKLPEELALKELRPVARLVKGDVLWLDLPAAGALLDTLAWEDIFRQLTAAAVVRTSPQGPLPIDLAAPTAVLVAATGAEVASQALVQRVASAARDLKRRGISVTVFADPVLDGPIERELRGKDVVRLHDVERGAVRATGPWAEELVEGARSADVLALFVERVTNFDGGTAYVGSVALTPGDVVGIASRLAASSIELTSLHSDHAPLLRSALAIATRRLCCAGVAAAHAGESRTGAFHDSVVRPWKSRGHWSQSTAGTTSMGHPWLPSPTARAADRRGRQAAAQLALWALAQQHSPESLARPLARLVREIARRERVADIDAIERQAAEAPHELLGRLGLAITRPPTMPAFPEFAWACAPLPAIMSVGQELASLKRSLSSTPPPFAPLHGDDDATSQDNVYSAIMSRVRVGQHDE